MRMRVYVYAQHIPGQARVGKLQCHIFALNRKAFASAYPARSGQAPISMIGPERVGGAVHKDHSTIEAHPIIFFLFQIERLGSKKLRAGRLLTTVIISIR
ncbi:hypothetical protein EVAR_97899_1 [Eumeta japonica]|uniref:Uncharacterized protein n=1 Tax=Eumeta variegata TaxID=151549 RepID=A0A4C1WGH9_EUMVA|nr:hypothetical protein EVAR_97899_1 [Eumeta japonica]